MTGSNFEKKKKRVPGSTQEAGPCLSWCCTLEGPTSEDNIYYKLRSKLQTLCKSYAIYMKL